MAQGRIGASWVAGLVGVMLAKAAAGQSTAPAEVVETGKVTVQGHENSYRVRLLPVSSFPDLPAAVAGELTARGCAIPQTYEAKRPENVIHGSFEKAGSSDWAALCAVRGEVSLLVFFSSGKAAEATALGEAKLTERLQGHDVTGDLGFNWGIDPAPPKRIHEAQAAMAHRPRAPDHDAIADSVADGKTIYRLFRDGAWETVDVE